MEATNGDTQKQPSSLNLHNTEELEKLFNKFDANHDGKISVSEIGDVLKALGSNFSDSELKRVLEDVDSNGDGFISLSEFSALCRSSSDAAAAAAELHDAFDLYDQDKNGLISAAELHQVLTRLGMPCNVEDCVKMIEPFDSDGDGNVSFQEFEKMMSSSIANNEPAPLAPPAP